MNPGWLLEQVISGGQTGVDQVGLEMAQWNNLRTGGWVPRGWRTDAGPAPWLGTKYGCREHKMIGYMPRTRQNVFDSDATVWFGVESPGYYCTHDAVVAYKKLYIENPTVSELQQFILDHQIRVLNVAGNRLRTYPESTATARVVLWSGLLPF